MTSLQASPARRLVELDALRGVAASTVVLSHILIIFPTIAATSWSDTKSNLVGVIKYSPLHLPFAGHEAVILFFVLSGYVLALPYVTGSGPAYLGFVVKRFWRIYPAYIVILLTAVLARNVLDNARGADLSDWYQRVWSGRQTLSSLASHVAMIANFNDQQYDPVLWSLIHEMRISLVFPALMVLVMRTQWPSALAVGLLCSVVGTGVAHTTRLDQYAQTLGYVLMFIVGALLAKHSSTIGRRYGSLSSEVRVALLAVAVCFYCYAWLWPSVYVIHRIVNDWAVSLGAAGFIVAAVHSDRCGSVLRRPLPVFLGRVSYSLYLIHAVVLVSLLHLGYGSVPLIVLLAATVVISVGFSALCYRFVEKPGIRVGRRLSQRIEAAQST